MTNTTNYNLLLAEGTDLVNYLTQTNPNFTNLDTIIKGVSDLTVTPATEVTTGTAHAISRSLPDATVIKFTATSNWQTGDTMTLDGTPVTPLKSDGTTLKTGDYIIGSAVLMIQDATRVTVLVASSPDASDINYDNTLSGLTANKVQGAIDEISSDLFKGSISVTGNGVKTYSQLLNELYALIDYSKLSVKSVLKDGTSVMPLGGFSPTTIGFAQAATSATAIYVSNYNLSTNSSFYSSVNNTISDYSNTAVANGRVIEIIY